MRKCLGNIAVMLTLGVALILGACSKEETKSFSVPSGSILVSMPGQTGTTDFESANITSISVTSQPVGWVINDIDMYKGTITVTAPSSFDNDEARYGNISLTAYTPTGATASVTIYVAILENEDVDYSAAPANCYVATKYETRYKFDPYTGGSSTPLATASVKLLWQTRVDLIKYLDLRDGYVTFYLENAMDDDDNALNRVYDGNAVIGAYNEAGELIWSWHIWVTSTDPTATENIVTINGQELMNINLGASCNSNGSTDHEKIHNSYGTYYQWGRKDPLPGPFSWRFDGNQDANLYNDAEKRLYLEYVASSSETGTTEWLRSNPLTIILGNPGNNYDWIYSGTNDTLWDTTTKSEDDPCPHGWRVPDGSVYETLTIAAADDNMPWAEAQPLYGWRLEDTTNGSSYFFSAAGRRNYMDGRLDNMNDDMELPVPWSGYYWTASTNGAKANAMYFDLNTQTRTWNGFDSAHAMHRANALPIRCVREK